MKPISTRPVNKWPSYERLHIQNQRTKYFCLHQRLLRRTLRSHFVQLQIALKYTPQNTTLNSNSAFYSLFGVRATTKCKFTVDNSKIAIKTAGSEQKLAKKPKQTRKSNNDNAGSIRKQKLPQNTLGNYLKETLCCEIKKK